MKNLYLCATRHNEGKTVLAAGLARALAKRGKRVGYLKPLGRGNLEIGENRIDADAALMREVCGLNTPVTDITAVVLEGFPADWTTREGRDHVVERVRHGLQRVGSNREFVLVEGTGNAATGAAFGLSAAYLAKLANARVLILSSGGVGQPTDEAILNKSYFERAGVEVLGVVVNKAYPHEFERLNSFMKPVLESMAVRMLGAVPYDPDLARPTMRSLMDEFRGRVVNGVENLGARLGRFVLGAHTAAGTLEQLQGGVTLLCPCDREDVLLAALTAFLSSPRDGFRLQGIVFAGKTKPDERAMAILRRTTVPAIHVELDAYSTAAMIHSTSYKIAPDDADRQKRAEELVTKHVDVGAILEGLQE